MANIVDLFSTSKETAYKKGEIILYPTDTVDTVFYLESGNVLLMDTLSDGREVYLHIFEKGSVFPIHLALLEEPSDYTFVALNDVIVYKENASKISEKIKKDPALALMILQRFAGAVKGLSTRIKLDHCTNISEKTLLLLRYLTNRFGKEKEGYIQLEKHFSHQDLASWIGCSRETITRTLRDLKTKGAIKVEKNRIYIAIEDIAGDHSR